MKVLLTQQNLEDILLPFLASTNEPLLNATQTILNNLSMYLFLVALTRNRSRNFLRCPYLRPRKQQDVETPGRLPPRPIAKLR